MQCEQANQHSFAVLDIVVQTVKLKKARPHQRMQKLQTAGLKQVAAGMKQVA